MQHFTFINQNFICKNKLENSIYELLHSYNRLVIPDDNLKDFQLNLLEQIEHCNNFFPRCKPIKAGWWQNTNKGDWHLSLDGRGIVYFHIYYATN